MASDSEWNAERMLQIYMHDYMKKRGMDKTAAIFRKETDVSNDPVAIETPEAFLHEWWSIFYERYCSAHQKHQETGPEASSKSLQKTDNERKNLPPRIPQLSVREQRPEQFRIDSNIHKMMDQPAAHVLPSRVHDTEYHRYLSVKDVDPSLQLITAKKLKFLAGTSSNHPQQDTVNVKQVEYQFYKDFGIDVHLESNVNTWDLVQRALRPSNGPRETRANEGLYLVPPLNGRPLNNQVLTSLLQAPNYQQQLQVLKTQNQQAPLTQVLACTLKSQTSTLPGKSSISNRQDLRIPLTETELRKKDRQGVIIAADDKPVDENIESFLSNENDHADHRTVPISNLKRISATCDIIESEDFSFEEVGCLHSSKNKVLSCNFSSDGKVLASAGHEKKVFIWNMETFDCVTSSEAHSDLITDVRFKPGSTIFATSSFDKTIKIWDAARPNKPLFDLSGGHDGQVTSMDFHPRKVDLLCSCDRNDIIRLWNVNQRVCLRVTKGGSEQIRFQPRFAKFLATATGNNVNIIDIESDKVVCKLEGHVKDVLSICWDVRGSYVASVSEDSARVWSIMSGGECTQELHSNGNKFQSCIFHPVYFNLLIIGCHQSLEFWIPTESCKTWSLPAHKGTIAGLGASPQNQMVASASHDHCVKLWK